MMMATGSEARKRCNNNNNKTKKGGIFSEDGGKFVPIFLCTLNKINWFTSVVVVHLVD